MKLIPMSRKDIESATFTEPCVAICIAYPNGRLHRVEANGPLLAVHHVRFSDCDGEGKWCFPDTKDDATNKPIPMTKGQAIDIVEFVEKWKEKVSTIYVACYGGISRSAGVLAGLAAIHGWDDTMLYKTRIPNAWCKTLLIRTTNPQTC